MCTSEYPCEDTVKSSLCKPKREVAGGSQPGHHLDFRFPASRSMRKPTSVVYTPYSVIFSYSISNKLTVGYHQRAVEGKKEVLSSITGSRNDTFVTFSKSHMLINKIKNLD